MKAASVKEIKSALDNLPGDGLVSLCLRLIKFKKENKELATYVLFDEINEMVYAEIISHSAKRYFERI